MAIEFACPACRGLISAPDTAAGVTGPCPYCGAQVTAPQATGGAAELVQAPELPRPSGDLNPGTILTDAWNVASRFPALVFGGFALATLIRLAAGVVALGIIAAVNGVEAVLPRPGETSALADVVSGVVELLLVPLQLGPLFIMDELMARGYSDLGSLFKGYRRFGSIVGAHVLLWLATVAGALALIVGAFVVLSGFALAYMEIVDRGVGAVEAMRSSWRATQGHRLMVFANGLLLFLMGLSGVLACCVGVFFTVPLAWAGYAVLYRNLRGLEGRTT